MKLLLIALLFLCFSSLKAQVDISFKEDLSKEVTFGDNNFENDAIGFLKFQTEFTRLLQKSRVFKKDEPCYGSIDIQLVFDKTKNTHIQGVEFNGRSPTLSVNEIKLVLIKIFNKLIVKWRPAISNSEAIYKSYMVKLHFMSAPDVPIHIAKMDIDPTVLKSKEGNHCFTFYNINRDSVFLKSLFTHPEIISTYNGGIKSLKMDLNKLISSSLDSSHSDRVLDSVDISFFVNKFGRFGQIDTYQHKTNFEAHIVSFLRKLACNWKPAISGGRPLNSLNNYRFVYSYSSNNSKDSFLSKNMIIERVEFLGPSKLLLN